MQGLKTLYLALVLILICAMPTYAFDGSENLHINGFISQGYLKSKYNNFLTPDSTEGTTEFSEIGLAINTQVNDKLRAGLQFLARDLGREGNHDLKLDWGYGDYRHNDFLGIRAGKIKLPIGLYNEGTDSDFLRPTIFLPQSVYDETRREISNAATGAGLYGTLNLERFGYINYNLVYGSIEIAEDSNLSNYILELINNSFPAAAGNPVDSISFNNDYMFVASIVYKTPVNGLSFGVSYVDVKGIWQAEFIPAIDPFADLGITDTTISLDLNDYYVFSAEYKSREITLAAEYFQTERNITAFGTPFDDAVMEDGGYFLVAFPFPWHNKITVTSVYDLYFDEDTSGKFERKDLGLGFRYDFNINWLIKAEYHEVEGKGRLLSTFFNPQGTVEEWSYWAIKTSFNF